jgi:hypothetical protein
LAAFVKAQELSPEQYIQWLPPLDGTSPLPNAIVCINMFRFPTPGTAHWSSPRAGWVVPVTENLLQTRIDEKAPRLREYTKRVVENWLLLVAEGNKPSQLFEIPAGLNASAIASPFARTFYFSHMGGTVVELGAPQE